MADHTIRIMKKGFDSRGRHYITCRHNVSFKLPELPSEEVKAICVRAYSMLESAIDSAISQSLAKQKKLNAPPEQKLLPLSIDISKEPPTEHPPKKRG